jgi:Family of unknown function (DUF6169)
LPNPYNFSYEEGSKTYNFTTKNAIDYRVAFVVDETFSAVSGLEIPNVYQMVIEKVTDSIEQFDSSVSATIKNIVKGFFENSENAMIFFCDDSDKKAISRFNTFERWYWSSEMTNYISKVDNIIKCSTDYLDYILYTSLLYHKNNSNIDTLLEVYQTIEDILNSGK